MKKIKEFFKGLIPSKRRLIQVYAALLYNANLMGFVTGNIFVGKSKMVCLPGMNCYSCPGAIGACPLGSLQTALSSKNYKTITYLIGILLLYSIILGRTICGWLCPGGLFQELLYKIKTPKLKKNRITRILSYSKYVLLVVLVIYIPIIFAISAGKTIPAFCKYICPIGTFEGAIGLLSNPNNENYFDVLGPLFTWKFILLIIFIVASIFIFRFFCRFFCPLGAIYGLFNKLSILGIKVNDEKCNGCNACVNHCKMDVKHVGDHECIMCGDCIDVCHANAIDWKLIRKDIEADYEMNKDNSNDLLQENIVEEPNTVEPDDLSLVEDVIQIKPTIIEETKPKKNKKRFIINLTTTILATSLLVAAILYSNVNWSKDIGVKREETITELSINTYDDEVFELDNKYTFIYFFDNFNEEEFLANYSVFEGKDVNFIAVSSYSNRELNQKYFDTSLNVTYAYDTEDKYLLRKFSGNKYPYYVLGSPIIKKVRYQVSNSNNMLNSLYTGELDYVQPNAKQETIDELKSKASKGISYATSETSGYGYIGVNASKVSSMKVRQAIMHSINTLDTVAYYKGTASALYRSMSLTSWTYKKNTELSNATSYYPFIGAEVPADLDVVNPYYKQFVLEHGLKTGDKLSLQLQIEFIEKLVESAGYAKDGNGVYVKGSDKLKMTFTIAGESTDHPAYQALSSSANILNKCGFEITVSTDAQALKKLSTGALTVWAAAWSATIDPDMYQVYHMDSTASSVKNWGYDAIKANPVKYSEEYALLLELSDYIEQGRETSDQTERAKIYYHCLNLVMQLAVELPTYQRDDLYAYNSNKIDASTLNQDISPYAGLLHSMEKVSLLIS